MSLSPGLQSTAALSASCIRAVRSPMSSLNSLLLPNFSNLDRALCTSSSQFTPARVAPGFHPVVCRVGGGTSFAARPSPGGRRPSGGKGKGRGQESEEGPLTNESIRCPAVRLLGEDNSMLGIVTREEALQAAKLSDLDLVLIAPEAEPPVARIMDFGKFRYEQQKKKKDQQRRSVANRQETKELKMRYNIDIGDYNVRLKQAVKFLKEGDKVKVSAQFRGREMEFKGLGVELFERFAGDLAELAVVETKAQMEGKVMRMILVPNKVALAKTAAAEKKQQQQLLQKPQQTDQVNGPVIGGTVSPGLGDSEAEEDFSDESDDILTDAVGTVLEDVAAFEEADSRAYTSSDDEAQQDVGTFSRPSKEVQAVTQSSS